MNRRPPSATRTREILAACQLKPPSTAGGCYSWPEFAADFAEYWPQYLDGMPTEQQWRSARTDWRKGNTGWEAVQNAKSRAADAARKAAEPKLVHLGGRHWTHEGSVLHQKHLALVMKDEA